jgi:RNA polymerase primary sigma factor
MRRALDEQSRLIRLPAYIIEARRRAEKALRNLTTSLGREPNLSEVAQAVGMTKSQLCQLLETPKQFLSLDSPIEASDHNTTVADVIRARRSVSPEEEILFQARQEVMKKLLSTLSRRQEAVIKLRYGLFDGKEHTLAEIGAKLKISRERVRQIEVEAKRKLKHPTRRHYWKEFLG